MAIEACPYYPKQMNGPVISAMGQAVDEQFSDAETIENYLYNLSIDTARETELDTIGQIIGYIRPLVPEGFNSENILLLGPLPLTQDVNIGLSSVGSLAGGQLSSVIATDSGFMAPGIYRKFLKSMAILKRYGLTLYSIDKIVSIVSTNYTIEWDANKDINVIFGEDIGYKNTWVLTQLFYRIATAPQVNISVATEEEEED